MRRRIPFLVSLAWLAAGALAAGQVAVASPDLRIFADTDNYWCSLETASGQDLLYYSAAFPALGTTRQVFNLNGSAVDLQTAVSPADIVQPVAASGSGLGAKISMAKRYGNLTYGSTWTVVSDPHTGAGAGYVQIVSTVTNNGPVAAHVGLRLELDVQLIDTTHDNAYLSIDNGLSVYDRNTLIQGATAPVPSDWWTYDAYPGPNLIGRGVTWGNAYNAPATQPDAVEFCHWDEVAGSGMWDAHPGPGVLFSSYTRQDTAVVLWYTGVGQAGYTSSGTAYGNGYTLPAGQSIAWVTYYGVNTQALGASPTPYLSFTPTPSRTVTPTISPTHTISPTFTVSPTITPTHSITPTFSVSPTFSHSPTVTQSFTITPTLTVTPTFSHSPTRTPSYTATLSATPTPSVTVTPTFSHTATITATFTVTPTFSITPTHSISPTFTVSPTLTETPPPQLVLTPKPPNPNPSDGSGVWLPYVLSRDAEVSIRVYDVAGETVRDLNPYPARQGANEEFWDERNSAGARVASGVFIIRITAKAAGEEARAWEKCAIAR